MTTAIVAPNSEARASESQNVLILTLSADLGSDRVWPLRDVNLNARSSQHEVFTVISQILAEENIAFPRESYTMSYNASNNNWSVYPKTGVGSVEILGV